MTTKLTAVIPARSGSKRLLNKNIKKLAGRPLIFHTLDSVVAQKCIQEIIWKPSPLVFTIQNVWNITNDFKRKKFNLKKKQMQREAFALRLFSFR